MANGNKNLDADVGWKATKPLPYVDFNCLRMLSAMSHKTSLRGAKHLWPTAAARLRFSLHLCVLFSPPMAAPQIAGERSGCLHVRGGSEGVRHAS